MPTIWCTGMMAVPKQNCNEAHKVAINIELGLDKEAE